MVEVAIGVLVEERDDGRYVLIARRPKEVVLGGYWELPGGKLEPGESAPDCLRREFLEEVGLGIDVERPLAPIEHRYQHAHVRLQPFLCRRRSGEPRNLAVAEHRWVRPRELTNYRFPPANASLIQEVMRLLDDGAPSS